MLFIDSYFFFDRHSCVILPKNQENTEDRILIVSQYKTAYIYNIQRGTTSIAGTMNQKRGFSQVVKINSKIYVVGGDYHTQLVEAYDEDNGIFEKIDISLIKGRSRFAFAVATKDKIRSLGVGCS